MDKKNIKILVADDSAFMRKFVMGYLGEIGLTNIVEAKNGRDAIQIYHEEKPDLVLMDIIMPLVTGLEALKEMVPAGAKVIIVSAVGQKQFIEEAVELGAVDYVIKPFFTAKELEEKIDKALAK